MLRFAYKERVFVTEREALIAMNMVSGLGAITAKRMAGHFGSLAAVFDASETELAEVQGVSMERAGQFLAALRQAKVAEELDRAERAKVKLITWADEGYPELLRQIADPPLVLYLVGSLEALSMPSVAIVGTRRPTVYGREAARRFGYQLACAGYTVVSGLALGIDAEAHYGALQAKGRTAAVLGGALDRLFPRENRDLARDIAHKGGAVVSEYPFGRQPDRQTFPMRNRIVSGLSKGVLVIEASLTSGTLITVGQALDQNRSVMAIPGRIDSPASQGCHKLLREGARLVTTADDVVEELQDLLSGMRLRRSEPQDDAGGGEKKAAPPQVVLTADERSVMKRVEAHGTTVDEVIRGSGLDAGKVNAILVGLQIKRLVRLQSGGIVTRRTDRGF